MNELTLNQEKSIGIASNYIIDVTIKQCKILDVNTLYGDGSRFKPLTLLGFNEVYKSTIELIKSFVNAENKAFENVII